MKTKPLSRKTRSLKAIKRYVKSGYSTNEIQRRLRQRDLGMRRKRILEEIRLLKKREIIPEKRQKYIPLKYRKKLVSAPKAKIVKLYRACVVMNKAGFPQVPITSRPFARNYLSFRVCGFHVDKGYLSAQTDRLRQILIRETEIYVGYKSSDWWWEVELGYEYPTEISVSNANFLNRRWIFRVEKEGRELQERSGYL